MSKTEMLFGLLRGNKTKVTELKYNILADFGLKSSIPRFFICLKYFKVFFPLCQKFGLVTYAFFVSTQLI
jgi:hypothetical protein